MVLPFHGKRTVARLIDVLGGKKVYGVACGRTACEGGRFHGRLIDVKDGRKVYGVTSECCQPPADPATAYGVFDPSCNSAAAIAAAVAARPFLVEKNHFPPYGLSRVIRVTLVPVLGCLEKSCLTAYLIYQETPPTLDCVSEAIPSGHGTWVGCVGGVDVVLWVTETQTIRVCVSGCVEAIAYDVGLDPCTLGALGQVDGQFPANDCCDCPNASSLLGMFVKTFCGPRRLGRLVGVRHGRKVYAVGDCCGPDVCSPPEQDCCTPLEGCTLVAAVEATGCCSDLSGVYPLPPTGVPFLWETAAAIPACDRHWMVEANCGVPDPVNAPAEAYMTVRVYSVDPGGDCGPAVTHTVPIPHPCYPLEVVFEGIDLACVFAEDWPGDRCVPSDLRVTISL